MSAPARNRQIQGLSPRAAAVHALTLTVAVIITWDVVTGIAGHLSFLSSSSRLLSGMWSVAATAFVYREGFNDSQSFALARLLATLISFALTLAYFLLFPFTPWGMAIVIGVGALIADRIGRGQDSVTVSITTAVVMVVADLGPASQAWEQPILRLAETILGGVIGLVAAWTTRKIVTPIVGPG